MIPLLLLWVNYILPFLELTIHTGDEPLTVEQAKLALANGGFVFLSLWFTLTSLPYYLTSWTFGIASGINKIRQKIKEFTNK